VNHYLRDKGFLIKVPASWRELYASGQKLFRLGVACSEACKAACVSRRWSGSILLHQKLASIQPSWWWPPDWAAGVSSLLPVNGTIALAAMQMDSKRLFLPEMS
jgi:hypothetical protein